MALTLYQKAAEGGDHYAQRILGLAYENENCKFYEHFGQLTDEDEALRWFKKASTRKRNFETLRPTKEASWAWRLTRRRR